MKKACIVLISIIIVGICVFCGYKLLQSFVLLEPTVLQQVESPDRKYTAYVFHCEGTREKFTYRLSIIESDKKLKKSVGNTYISDSSFDVSWIDNGNLKVNNYPTIDIFKQKQKVGKIKIQYNYLKD